MTDPVDPVPAQALNMRQLYELVESLRAQVRTVVCSPDEAPVVVAAIAGFPLVIVRPSQLVPPGTAYVVGPPELITVDFYLDPAVLTLPSTAPPPEGWLTSGS